MILNSQVKPRPLHFLFLDGEKQPQVLFEIWLRTRAELSQARKFGNFSGMIPHGRLDDHLNGIWFCDMPDLVFKFFKERSLPHLEANSSFGNLEEFFNAIGYDGRRGSFLQDRAHICLEDLKAAGVCYEG